MKKKEQEPHPFDDPEFRIFWTFSSIERELKAVIKDCEEYIDKLKEKKK